MRNKRNKRNSNDKSFIYIGFFCYTNCYTSTYKNVTEKSALMRPETLFIKK